MQINKLDNVDVNLEDGHKYALRDIKAGENIIKYGNPIGHATEDIKTGEHVHSHNVKTNLSGNYLILIGKHKLVKIWLFRIPQNRIGHGKVFFILAVFFKI